MSKRDCHGQNRGRSLTGIAKRDATAHVVVGTFLSRCLICKPWSVVSNREYSRKYQLALNVYGSVML